MDNLGISNEIPVAANAESCYLGSIIQENQLIPTLTLNITSDTFYVTAHQIIYSACLSAYEKYKRLDLVLLKEELGPESLRTIGGIQYLSSLISHLPSPSTPVAYRDIMLHKWRLRQALAAANAISNEVKNGESMERIASLADAFRLTVQSNEREALGKTINNSLVDLDRMRHTGNDLAFGIDELDLTLGGIRRGLLYTIGGKTSQGKTSVAINIVRHNLQTNENSKIIYDVFENAEQIATRLASQDSGMKLERYLKPHLLDDVAYDEVRSSLNALNRWTDRLTVVQNASIARLRSLSDELKPDIVIVDYLQRYAHRYALATDGRLSHEIGKVVSDLQDLAIEKNCAVFCFSQLSRRSEEQRGRPPQIEDLKESGDIENYSDVIIMLHWPWRDTLDSKKRPNEYKFLIRKNKIGPCLDVSSYINLDTLKISESI